jgi:membrane protease YdiL (CAAX protease family)
MPNNNFKLYLVFTVTFLVMHFSGLIAADLPYIVNALITFAIVLATLLLLLWVSSGNAVKDSFSSIGLHKTGYNSLLPGIIVSAALLFAYPLLGFLLNTKIVLAKDWHLNLAGLFLTGGLAEEILFRGYFFGSLRQKMNFRKAVFLSAILFSLAHLLMFAYMDWPVALLSTLLAIASSVPLAFLYEKGGNTIWSPAIVHTTIRTVGLVVTTDEKLFMKFSLLWITVSMVLPYIVLLFYKDFRSAWTNKN